MLHSQLLPILIATSLQFIYADVKNFLTYVVLYHTITLRSPVYLVLWVVRRWSTTLGTPKERIWNNHLYQITLKHSQINTDTHILKYPASMTCSVICTKKHPSYFSSYISPIRKHSSKPCGITPSNTPKLKKYMNFMWVRYRDIKKF